MRYHVVGDIHGCADELWELLEVLGFKDHVHPDGDQLVSVGDLVDRQHQPLEVIETLQQMQVKGSAHIVLGNHDANLLRYLNGYPPDTGHGFEIVHDALEARGSQYKDQLRRWLSSLPEGIAFEQNGKRLLVEHGHKLDPYAYNNEPPTTLVHGHFALSDPYERSCNQIDVVDVDTGCCYGGKLTAYTWPDGYFTFVRSGKTYHASIFEVENYAMRALRIW